MPLIHNTLSQILTAELPIWQAPLPFSLFSADYSGRISAAGAVGLLRVGEAANKMHMLSEIKRFRAHGQSPAICFSHRLPKHRRCSGIYSEDAQHAAQRLNLHSTIEEATSFSVLLEAALIEQPAAIGFSCGIAERDVIEQIKARHIPTFVICRNVLEAITAADFAIDIIVLQGMEAGGERAGFENDLQCPEQSAFSLLQQVRQYIQQPIVLWSDFSDGSDIVAALIAGAQGVMLDRPLLNCADSGLSRSLLNRLQEETEFSSLITEAYTARPLRCLQSAYLHEEIPPAEVRELLLHHYFLNYPERRPLSVSMTANATADSLCTFLNQCTNQIQRLIG